MFKETDVWSPDQELQLLEELAEAEAQAFDVEMELPLRVSLRSSRDRGWPTGTCRRTGWDRSRTAIPALHVDDRSGRNAR